MEGLAEMASGTPRIGRDLQGRWQPNFKSDRGEVSSGDLAVPQDLEWDLVAVQMAGCPPALSPCPTLQM